jgi:heme/copper-type cytochrome/quinol oxidase subunit 3
MSVGGAATTYDLGRARPNGWWGVVIFVAGEITLFLMLFASYFYLRLQSHHWPPPGVAKPAVLVPVLLTAALVATSFAMQRAWRAGRVLARAAAWRWLALAGVVQGAYLVWQVHDFVDLCRTEPPSHSAYASIHLTMLAIDHAHVLIGALLTAWLVARLATRITPYRIRTLQAVTFYWHAVNAITVAVLLVSLSPHVA